MIKIIIIILFLLLFSIYTIIDMIVGLFISLVDKELLRKHSINVVKFVFRVIVLIAGVEINYSGIENIKSLNDEKSYFIISNHRGYFDIITGYLLFEKDTGIVSKDDLKKVPLLYFWMKRINCLFLNRKDLRDGLKMVLDAINNINNGISMWIFPEGTRCKSKNPLDMLEFKQGTFKIPEKADCYILPISFRNTEMVFENQFPRVKSARVYINIGVPYKISELTENNKKNIAAYSQEVVKNLLVEEKKWQTM